MWPLQKEDPGTLAGRDGWTLWSSIGRPDRLSDGGLSPAPARGGSAAGAGSGNPDQLGKYAEVLGRSQCSRSRPLSGTGKAMSVSRTQLKVGRRLNSSYATFSLLQTFFCIFVSRPRIAANDQRSRYPIIRRKFVSVTSQADATHRCTMSASRQRVTLPVRA